MSAVLILLLLGQAVPDGAALQRASAARQAEAVLRQTGSLELVKASVERQRASARLQVGTEAPREHFLTAPLPAPVSPLPPEPGCERMHEDDIRRIVETAARKEGLTPDLLRAVIRKESGDRPCAVSPKGALGLMQLMPETAADLRVRDPLDPEENVLAGTRLLKVLLTRYGGDLSLALGAYNAGPGRIERFGGLPPFPETINYVGEILEALR